MKEWRNEKNVHRNIWIRPKLFENPMNSIEMILLEVTWNCKMISAIHLLEEFPNKSVKSISYYLYHLFY
jgi:hypothetical protein